MRLFRLNMKDETRNVTPEVKLSMDRLKDVDQMVLDYINASSTDYAIMLTGAWGAGKTFYWKNALKQSIEEIDSPVKIKGNNVKYKAVHVSLFGVENLNSLIMRIARAKYIDTDNKLINSATTLTIAGIKKLAKKYEVDGDDLKLLIKILKDVDSQRFVFCFDDLERLNKKVLLEVLGYINSMVENDGVKVVVLCNEKELLAKIGEENEKVGEYRTYKEKLIRFTYQMTADIDKVLGSIIDGRDQQYARYIMSQKDFIVSFYKKGECNNIRTLKFNIDVYEKLFQMMLLLNLGNYEDSVRAHYLMLSMLYAIEYKKGTATTHLHELLDLTSEGSYAFDFDFKTFHRLAGIEPQEDNEPTYLEKVKDRYFGCSPAKNGSSEALLEYIKTGRFDEDRLKNDVMNTLSLIQNKELSEEQQLMSALNDIWTIEDEKLRDTIDIIIRKVKMGEFALDLMPAAFARIKTYIEGGFLEGPSVGELKTLFKKGVQKAKPRTVYSDDYENKYSMMSNSLEPDIKEIADEVLEFYKKLGKESFIRSFRDSLERLWTEQIDMNEFVTSRYDILNSLNAYDIFERFKAAKNVERQRFAAFLQSRVEYRGIASEKESAFLKKFKKLTDAYVRKNSTPSTLRKYCLYISEFLKKYNI